MTATLMQLPIAKVRIDGGTQMRVAIKQDAVESYAARLKAGTRFVPVIVFQDSTGSYWLADGFHRVYAHVQNGARYIDAEVRVGEKRDAVLFAIRANRDHGVQMTREDKRKCVEKLLDDPEWSKWSNREVADYCDVSEGLVRIMKGERVGKPAEAPEIPATPKVSSKRKPESGSPECVITQLSDNQPEMVECEQPCPRCGGTGKIQVA